MSPTDFYGDQGALSVKLFHDQELPDFVKSAEYVADFDLSDVPSTSFADPHRRLFPCHTPADTYLSAGYYHARKEAADPGVEMALRKFARIHQIEAEVDQVRQVATAYRENQNGETKTAAAPARAFKIESSFGTWQGAGPGSLQKAAASFVANFLMFPVAELSSVAREFDKEAALQGADLPLDVRRFAGETVPDARLARTAVAQRSTYVRERGDRQKMAQLVEELEMDDLTKEDAFKLAEFLETFDAERGLNFRWGREVVDPLRSVFGEATEKTAGDERTVEIGGRTIKFAEFDEEVGKLALGEDFTRERLVSLTAEESGRLAQYL